MAYLARQEAVGSKVGEAERSLDSMIQRGLNWSIISQPHAFSVVHVDTSGVWTAIVILTGSKLWAVRKTNEPLRNYYPNHEPGIIDTTFFVDLSDRTLQQLPGGFAAWTTVLLKAGSML